MCSAATSSFVHKSKALQKQMEAYFKAGNQTWMYFVEAPSKPWDLPQSAEVNQLNKAAPCSWLCASLTSSSSMAVSHSSSVLTAKHQAAFVVFLFVSNFVGSLSSIAQVPVQLLALVGGCSQQVAPLSLCLHTVVKLHFSEVLKSVANCKAGENDDAKWTKNI